MKNSILKLAAGLFITGAMITSCSTPSQKVENAQDNVSDAEKDLETAKQEYRADMREYKQEVSLQIADNNEKIAELNTKIVNEKADAKADYKKKIAVIEKKNNDMQARIDGYQDNGKAEWMKFKTEFKHDMDELGQSFKDFDSKSSSRR